MNGVIAKILDPELRKVYTALVVLYLGAITIMVFMQMISVDDWSGKFFGGLALIASLQIPASSQTTVDINGNEATVTTGTPEEVADATSDDPTPVRPNPTPSDRSPGIG